MGLSMEQRKAVARETARRYRRATKAQKGSILDEYVELTGRTRNYSSWLLRNWGTEIYDWRDGDLVKIVVGRRRRRRQATPFYDRETRAALKKVWMQFGCMCGKRLVVVLRTMLPVLEKFGEIQLDPPVRAKLQQISAATIDRLLQDEKRKQALRGRSHTKPTTSLMQQIPIRTFSEWNEVATGVLGLDLVGHDGGNAAGEFAFTLVATDRRTQWTELRAVPNKAQKWVFQQLLLIRSRLPFELRGIHSDNGSEFINNQLHRYCRTEGIHFTRSRAYRKNDNNFTEQKNNDLVRKHVGYLRHDSAEEVTLLNEIYDNLRLLANFFYPSVKLVEKTRRGARVSRRYDSPTTPYQRLLESGDASEHRKQDLQRQFAELNPVELQRKVIGLQQRLSDLTSRLRLPLRRVS